ILSVKKHKILSKAYDLFLSERSPRNCEGRILSAMPAPHHTLSSVHRRFTLDHRSSPRGECFLRTPQCLEGLWHSPSKVLLYLVTLCLPQGATILWRRGKDVDSAGESLRTVC